MSPYKTDIEAPIGSKSLPPNYRPDIDGLRAIAVLTVLVFHANSDWMPGGFLGVDVFFVISGFLITRIIYSDLENQSFTFANFYARRARRIAPAMLSMVFVTLVAALFLLSEEHLKETSLSAMSATWGLSNLYFWLQLDSGYFADATDTVLLLHTWSLGVEEQFYIILPPLLIAISLLGRARRKELLIASLVIVSAASFWHADAAAKTSPSYAYYTLLPRMGELAIGSALALMSSSSQDSSATAFLRSRLTAELLGGLGLLLVLFGFTFVDATTTFPGYSALPTVVGTALIIYSSQRGPSIIGRLLSAPWLVWFGLISYSLYLWHWPIMATTRTLTGDLTATASILCIVASVVVAYLSYTLVEKPTRRIQLSSNKQILLAFLAAPSVFFTLLAATTYLYADKKISLRPIDHGERVMMIEKMTRSTSDFNEVCQMHDVFAPDIFHAARCVSPSSRTSHPSLLLIGDSNAAHYVGFLTVLAEEGDFSVRNSALSTCPPLLSDNTYGMPRYQAACTAYRSQILAEINRGDYESIVLGGQWMTYSRLPDFWRDLDETISLISQAGSRIIILEQVPVFPNFSRSCERDRGVNSQPYCELMSSTYSQEAMEINDLLRARYSNNPDITFLGVESVLCTDRGCNTYFEGVPTYFNTSHMSMEGSRRLGEAYVRTNGVPDSLRSMRSQPHGSVVEQQVISACENVEIEGIGRWVEPVTYRVGGFGKEFSTLDSLYMVVRVNPTSEPCMLEYHLRNKSSNSNGKILRRSISASTEERLVTVVLNDARKDRLIPGSHVVTAFPTLEDFEFLVLDE